MLAAEVFDQEQQGYVTTEKHAEAPAEAVCTGKKIVNDGFPCRFALHSI